MVEIEYLPIKSFIAMTQTTLTGSWIALAGIIVSVAAHFNIVFSQDSIEAIIAGAITAYGIIHQIVVHLNAKGVVATTNTAA
jgi:hypothetical protein